MKLSNLDRKGETDERKSIKKHYGVKWGHAKTISKENWYH